MSAVATARSAPVPMARGTLSRQLVVRTTAMVAAIAVALTLLTAITTWGVLQRQLDDQIEATSARVVRDPRPSFGNEPRKGPGGTQQIGLLVYVNEYSSGYVQTDDGPVNVSTQALSSLSGVEVGRSTLYLDGLGLYRLSARSGPYGVVVTGLPLDLVTGPMTILLFSTGLLTLGAITIAFFAARQLVTASLRPLARLATTAHHVSGLELDRGEVAVPVRVPTADADPASEVGQVGIAFNHMLDRVEGALAARQRSETKVRQFVADASHELRNPLASIRGYAELTRRSRDTLPGETSHALARIESESERMSSLVEDLLLLARLDSGPDLVLEPVELGQLVADAVSDAQVAGPDHEWLLELPDADVHVSGDPHRLHQVVVNLLANARTHTPQGTHVRTALRHDATHACIDVIDDGPGIPDAVRDTLFERFTRADASRVRQGGVGSSTGLGLAIVAAVVDAHGGTAHVSSPPGGGTAFTVTLPLLKG